MATCKTCNYPYVGKGSCPNCGEKYPIKTTLFGLLFIGAIIWAIIYFVGPTKNSNDFNENSKIVSTTETIQDKETSKAEEYASQESNPDIDVSDENDYVNNHRNYQDILYECRECGIGLSWKDSYYWMVYPDVNGGVTGDISQVGEQDQYADRYTQNEYYDEGTYTTGLFCSENCANKNVQKFSYPQSDLDRWGN